MALDVTVGGAGADSFDTLVNFKTYAGSIGFSLAGREDAQLEVALRRGAQYLTRAYRGRWKGYRFTSAQALPWPRAAGGGGIIDEDGYEIPVDAIPRQVKEAQFEATILVLQGIDLLPRQERGGAVQSKAVKAGPVSTETVFRSDAPTRDRILSIDGLLAGVIESQPGATAGSGTLIRS